MRCEKCGCTLMSCQCPDGATNALLEEWCCVEVNRDGDWQLVGQYNTRKQANLIAADYRSRGETARVRSN